MPPEYDWRVLIEVRDGGRESIGVIDLADGACSPARPAPRPARVSIGDREVLLRWEGATDDAGRLRHCLVCGCPTLHRARRLPHVTPLLLAACAIALGIALLGYATHPALIALIVLLIGCDVWVLAFAKTHLACYRCRTTYRGVAIARWHRNWDPFTSRRLARPPTPPTTPPSVGR